MKHEADWPSKKKVTLVHFVKIQLQSSPRFSCQSQQNSSLGDLTKLKKRHRQPLKTTFNSGVLQNPTSGKARRAGREEGPEMYNGNYSSYGRSSCSPVVENHPSDRTAASALRHWLHLPQKKLTLASVYNQPHTIRRGIKFGETYLYFLLQRRKIKRKRPMAGVRPSWQSNGMSQKYFEKWLKPPHSEVKW